MQPINDSTQNFDTVTKQINQTNTMTVIPIEFDRWITALLKKKSKLRTDSGHAINDDDLQ